MVGGGNPESKLKKASMPEAFAVLRYVDHRDFLATLPAAEKADLTARSDRAGLWHLAGHGGLILVTGAAIAARVPFWPLLLPVQGCC